MDYLAKIFNYIFNIVFRVFINFLLSNIDLFCSRLFLLNAGSKRLLSLIIDVTQNSSNLL